MKDSFQFLRPYLWRYRHGFSLGLGALTIKDLLAVVQPLVIRAAIDHRHVRSDAMIAGASEIAFFPPMTGG